MRRMLCLALALVLATACGGAGTDLSRAAHAGNLAEVKRLLAAGADPNPPTRGFEMSPLALAAQVGSNDVVTALLDAGADPEAESGINDWTVLVNAVHTEQRDTIRLLLSRTHPGKENLDKALEMAAAYGLPDVVQELLAAGATGSTEALTGAVGGSWDIDAEWKGCGPHTETVRVLREASPDLRLPDSYAGRAALRFARTKGCTEMLGLVDGGVRAAR
ncbi:MAG TPA: ankyrin repeat domain-containing protein [Candidatus Polarisedimenticolaceae bacterium]|nr:ankyrin repeat domain-containing protein [Candidatus Polarisedimenticolaceae bacterium]